MAVIRILTLLLFLPFTVLTQIHTPVTWSYSHKQISDTEFELYLKAIIDNGWHLYSQFLPSDDGPIATSFTFNDNTEVQLIGKVTEPKAHTEYDPNFEMDLSFHSNSVTFTQKVSIASNSASVSGELEFMVCDDKMCLPPEIEEFTFELKKTTQNKAPPTKTDTKSIEETHQEPINQIYEPVIWNYSVVEKEGEYFIKLNATIQENWHLYALELPRDDGPNKTEINFFESDDFKTVGKPTSEGEVHNEYDPNFEMELTFYSNQVTFLQKIEPLIANAIVKGEVYFMACDDKMCIPPAAEEFELALNNKEVAGTSVTSNSDEPTVFENETQKESKKGLWAIFVFGFIGGFAALLTPCVFPMIPLTVSFFTKQSKTRAKGISNALFYGASIILIYVLLGFGVTSIFGADALNVLSTDPYFNIFFFLLLSIFAISFLGAFEITLPNSWVNKMDSASDKGGMIGIFFMAFTLSLVSFSCTGPIIGTLLVEAAVNGGVQGPLIGMFGFSLALALPFGLFAAFPGWLNSLPQSGGWLNTVKVVLGFLELALALKFLSNADLVLQAGYLKREVFIAIWIGIFMMLTLYLLGVFKLPHDSPLDKLSVGRALFASVVLIFTIYLIPGLWGAPLKIISGFPPPMFYSESPKGLVTSSASTAIISATPDGEVVGEPEHCPHGLNCFHDYDEGLAYAKKVNKPVMLDFTGWACVNCRKMEEQVWSDPKVLKILRDEVVLISLYVDEKLELPKEEQIEVTIGTKTKKLKTVGNKWSYFQADRYKTNSQPYYVILDLDENQLNEAASYDPDIELFIDWLNDGVEKFN